MSDSALDGNVQKVLNHKMHGIGSVSSGEMYTTSKDKTKIQMYIV